jgi:hypothetical protein
VVASRDEIRKGITDQLRRVINKFLGNDETQFSTTVLREEIASLIDDMAALRAEIRPAAGPDLVGATIASRVAELEANMSALNADNLDRRIEALLRGLLEDTQQSESRKHGLVADRVVKLEEAVSALNEDTKNTAENASLMIERMNYSGDYVEESVTFVADAVSKVTAAQSEFERIRKETIAIMEARHTEALDAFHIRDKDLDAIQERLRELDDELRELDDNNTVMKREFVRALTEATSASNSQNAQNAEMSTEASASFKELRSLVAVAEMKLTEMRAIHSDIHSRDVLASRSLQNITPKVSSGSTPRADAAGRGSGRGAGGSPVPQSKSDKKAAALTFGLRRYV